MLITMIKKTSDWKEQRAIGNIAESIVEFLINSVPNWKCIKYGMENHIGELRILLRDNYKDETSRRIKTMPDFIAVNEKTNKVLLIDVKYRSFIDRREDKRALYGFSYGQIKDYLDFWTNSYLIVIHNHEPYFFVINVNDIEWHKHFHMRKNEGKELIELWNFAGIQKGIKDIFPEISDNAINTAINMIPKIN